MHVALKALVFCGAFVLLTAQIHAGSWGYKAFENDDAGDWVENELTESGQDAVERSIVLVVRSNDYLPAAECCRAIAACEVLAAAQGRPSPDLPKKVLILAKKLSSKQTDELRKQARAALSRILSASELQARWARSEQFAEWRESIEALKARL